MMLPVALALAVADPVPPTPAKERSVGAAVQIVRNYYAAIQRHDFRTAHAIFANGHSVASMRRGYAQTASVKVAPVPPFETNGGVGSIYADINVTVDAALRSGVRQHFVGSYTLRRINDVDGSTAAQRRWHIIGAHLKKIPAGD